MRILHIVGSISPAAGGPTEAVRMLVEHAPEGFTAEVVTTDDPASEFLKDFPYKITAVGSSLTRWRVPALTTWLRENRNRFDGVILHGLWEYTGVAVRSAIAGHKPYVVFPHGMLDPYFKRRFPLKHLKKFVYWYWNEKLVLTGARCVLFTTKTEAGLAKESFSGTWREKITPLGAEPPAFNPTVSVPKFLETCPGVSGKHFLLFLGRLHPKKGPDLLLRAFAAAGDADGNLVMAGPSANEYRADLQDLATKLGIAKRVHWPGMLLGEAKWGALAACEAFVLTSHQENFGIAVVEALACGKPVLLTKPINIAEDCRADGCALVEEDTVEGATRLLREWNALSSKKCSAMSQQALETFEKRYDMRKNTAAILHVFDGKL
jgi:glycosyltransferase involved in cell wall biosynthesis